MRVDPRQQTRNTFEWQVCEKSDPVLWRLAARHYTRRDPSTSLFCPPGASLALRTEDGKAGWITLLQRPEYTHHDWPNALQNVFFRNEGALLSSTLIRSAVEASAYAFEIPPQGFITFVNASKVRRKRDPGRCYRKAGWTVAGHTSSGLVALQLLPQDFPDPVPAIGQTHHLLQGGPNA